MHQLDIKTKRREFIESSLKHFNSYTRSKHCEYSGGCIIGRHLDKELAWKLDNYAGDNRYTHVKVLAIFIQLPDWLRELGKEFLYDMQQLHDCKSNWDAFGLTTKGYGDLACIYADWVH